MTVLVRVGTVASSRKVFAFELVKPSSVVVTGGGSETATISALGSVEFSAATALSLNDVFSSGYDNYMIVWAGTQTSAVSLHLRLRASGSDNSTSNSYVSQRLVADSTSVSAARLTTNFSYIGKPVSTQRSGYVVHIYGPSLAQPTALRSISASDETSATIYEFSSTHNQSTSYDGLTLFPDSSQNMTGRVAVYGMRG